MARTVQLKIYRYDPDKDTKPYMQDITVELKDTDKMLLDVLPVVLVEPGQVRRSGRPAAGLPLHRRLARRSHQRPPGQPGRPVPPVPLQVDHELHGRVPEGPESEQGDRQDQGNADPPRDLTRRVGI